MGSFGWGLLVGWLSSLVLASIGAVYAYRRLVVLERRTRQAERLAELGTLTGGLAHEIKNPLSTVQLNLQLLKEDIPPDNPAHPRVAGRLETVHRETSRLRDILDDFLRFAGKLEVDRKPTELNTLLDELVDFFTPQAQLQRVRLRLRRAPEDIVADVGAKLIKQAVLNLMINALQAMPAGGGELILSLTTDGRQANIDVIDTGTGIPPDAVEKIFQAYYSTKKGGTGLGLAMTHRIVSEHGGTIAVQSDVGKGSDFTISIPLKS
jgi:signal transduction histidine kinase